MGKINKNTDIKSFKKPVKTILKKVLKTKKSSELNYRSGTEESDEIPYTKNDASINTSIDLICKDSSPGVISKEAIYKAVEVFLKLLTKMTNSSNLFEEDKYIILEINCIKIPYSPMRIIRLPLAHPLKRDPEETLLIVCDLERGQRKDYLETKSYYEDLLKDEEVTEIKHVMPLRQLKSEYDQFELKHKLSTMYSQFLVDGKICGHVMHYLGKVFFKKRLIPVPIRTTNIKEEIYYGLRKASLYHTGNGISESVKVGHLGLSIHENVDNIKTVCDALETSFPGGWDNIRSIYIKTTDSIPVPLYITLRDQNNVPVPKINSLKPKRFKSIVGRLSTNLKSKIIVHPDGSTQTDPLKHGSVEETKREMRTRKGLRKI